jgi:hypothetical protein
MIIFIASRGKIEGNPASLVLVLLFDLPAHFTRKISMGCQYL